MQSIRKKSFAAEQLARQKKKNPATIAIIMLAVVIALGAVGYALYVRFGEKEELSETVAPVTEEKPSIAVLSLYDSTPKRDKEYICAGIADAIILALQHVKALDVISRNSSFVFKGENRNLRAIGDSLNVEYVLEGSLYMEGNNWRITTQLIKASKDIHVWGDKYDFEEGNLFAIQDSISLAIVDALKIELLGKEKTAIEKRYTENTEAYDLYLLGRYYFNTNRKKGFEYFQQAIKKDQNFALAYTGIADYYSWFGWAAHSLPPEDTFPKAKEAAEKALEIDETLAEALTSLAWINLLYDWDWSAAERRFKKAITLNPSYAKAHHGYYEYLMIMGRFDEALAEIKQAQALNPLPGGSFSCAGL